MSSKMNWYVSQVSFILLIKQKNQSATFYLYICVLKQKFLKWWLHYWDRKPHVTSAHAPGQQRTEPEQVSKVGTQGRTYQLHWTVSVAATAGFSMKAPTCNPGDLWQGTKFFCESFNFCFRWWQILYFESTFFFAFFFSRKWMWTKREKKNYGSEHKRNAKFEIKWSSDNHLSLSFPVLSLNNLIVSLPICFLSI